MRIEASDILQQLLKEAGESKIAPPPEDSLSFAEMLEKESSGIATVNPSPSMEEFAKLAVAQELLGNHAQSISKWSSLFENLDAILPDVTPEESQSAWSVPVKYSSESLTGLFKTPRGEYDEYLCKIASRKRLSAALNPAVFIGNPGNIGMFAKMASGLSGLKLNA